MTKSKLVDEIPGTVVDGGQEFVIKVKFEFILDRGDCLFFAGASIAFMEALKSSSNKISIRNGNCEAGC